MGTLYGGGGILVSIPSFVKEHYALGNIVISKGMNINYSHGELWGVMNSFICIIYDLHNGTGCDEFALAWCLCDICT